MTNFKDLTFTDKIKWRIRILRLIFVLMLIYIVIIGEIGGGDSRIMTNLATNISNLIYFGGLIYILCRIHANKKLLQNRLLLKAQMQEEQDERNQYLHDKTGGIVWDILFFALLFITVTTALFNMAAFNTAVTILAIAVLLKLGTCWFYSRNM